MHFAQRIQALEKNVFADMDRAKSQAISKGKKIIDLSLGSSDLPADPEAIATISASLEDPSTHGYLLHHGTLNFRETVGQWYSNRFGVEVDPQREVLTLIGSQEGYGSFTPCSTRSRGFCFTTRSRLSFPRRGCLFGWGANISYAIIGRK
ncbi:Aspartate aminotransferase [Crocosphaera watsonii WH 0402]|uniref:Aspartate aminotransferase n=1 Tax=Crocosphaera watsonii WH 0402 TaxID=1284629 RepID=T2JWS9_CROWT|nr:Aspartate aminotransferase [Crocosphaera watsonii WH 0402]